MVVKVAMKMEKDLKENQDHNSKVTGFKFKHMKVQRVLSNFDNSSSICKWVIVEGDYLQISIVQGGIVYS